MKELLRISHNDFTMYVESDKYADSFYRAVHNQNIPETSLTSIYTWTDGVTEVLCADVRNDEAIALENGKLSRPVFFRQYGLQYLGGVLGRNLQG